MLHHFNQGLYMKTSLETADTIAKLFLSALVVVLYFIGIISGPFVILILVLSIIVIFVFIVKTLMTKH